MSPSGNARIPAVNAPIKAAAAGGTLTRSTSSNRSVLAIAPIKAADTAREIGLLNIIKKPNTPQKLARSLKRIQPDSGNDIFIKSTGCKCRINAMIHADIVATRIINHRMRCFFLNPMKSIPRNRVGLCLSKS